jgi:DnaJ-domain-containing protein 1
MFSKSDPSDTQKRVRVELRMRSGESEKGSLLIAAHHTLRQTLSDDAPFLEIETAEGTHAFLLKTEIARIDPVNSESRQRPRDGDDWTRFDAKDARLVLGVAADATLDEIQSVWRALAKAYHPDRLMALGLPEELLRHAERVLVKVNAAYQSLRSEATAPV